MLAPREDLVATLTRRLEKEKARPDLYFKGITLAEVVSGVKYWELKAQTSRVNKSTGLTLLMKVEGTFFEQNLPRLGIVAPQAVWNMERREIMLNEAFGYSLEFARPDLAHPGKAKNSYWFLARNLNWKLKDKRLTCRDGITLTRGGINVTAKNFEADVGLQKVELTGKPRVTIEEL